MLRGSNSVSARIVHSKGSDEDREDTFERTMHLDEGELDSWAEHLAKKETEQTVQRKMRRVVRVLDLKDSSNTSSVKFIHFKERLHPWNTIKELKQKIYLLRGYHIHRQRLYLNNAELLNSQTLDYYGLLCEQHTIPPSQLAHHNYFSQQDPMHLDQDHQISKNMSNHQSKQTRVLKVVADQDLIQPAQKSEQQLCSKIKRSLSKHSKAKAILERERELIQSFSNQPKVVLLKLAPDLAKLSKLNQQNINKTADRDAYKCGESITQGKEKETQVQGGHDYSTCFSDKCLDDTDTQDNQAASSFKSFEMFGSMQCPKELTSSLFLIEQGLQKGLKPILTDDGTSGTWLLRGQNKQTLAVFKPIDEEAFAPNNPRDHIGAFGSKTFRAGVLSGEACIREVAAYLIDTDNFSGVPPTTMVETSHESLKTFKFSSYKIASGCSDFVDMMTSIIAPQNQLFEPEDSLDNLKMTKSKSQRREQYHQTGRFLKIGSLQKFMPSNGPLENFSSDLFPIQEIHKIAILDLRLMNLDRNETNILVRIESKSKKEEYTQNNNSMETSDKKSQSSYSSDLSSPGNLDYLKLLKDKQSVCSLIPIDHSLSIPDTLNICSWDLVWLSFSQAEQPFSQASLEYIDKIDVMADISKLERTFKFRPICLRNMRISSTLLKKCAKAGLTLAQIGSILCRPDDDDEQPSLLEQIVKRARKCANMMVQMQTKIKDSQLRLIIPHSVSASIANPDKKPQRRNSALLVPQTATVSKASKSKNNQSDSSDMDQHDAATLKVQQQTKSYVDIPVRSCTTAASESSNQISPNKFTVLQSKLNDESKTILTSGQFECEANLDCKTKNEPSLDRSESRSLSQQTINKGRFRFNRYKRRAQKKKAKKKKKKYQKSNQIGSSIAKPKKDSNNAQRPLIKKDQVESLSGLQAEYTVYSSIECKFPRKRGYSDVDPGNVLAFQQNNEQMLLKRCDQKFQGRVRHSRMHRLVATKTGMSKELREKQEIISMLLSTSQKQQTKQRSSQHNYANNNSASQRLESISQKQAEQIDNDPFIGFEYNYEKTPQSMETANQQQKPVLQQSKCPAQVDQLIANQSEDPQQKASQENFSSAVKRFNDGLGWKGQRLIKTNQEDQNQKHQHASNITHLLKSKNPNRRTISYVNFRISNESDDDKSDCGASNASSSIPLIENLGSTEERGRQMNSFKKIDSNESLVSSSNISGSSQQNKLGTKQIFGGNLKDRNKVQFYERRDPEIFQPGNNLYKQRRAQMHLERDKRWNGPHDEEFFRCFEQQLDIAISRFIRQLGLQNSHCTQLTQASQQLNSEGVLSWRTPVQNTSSSCKTSNFQSNPETPSPFKVDSQEMSMATDTIAQWQSLRLCQSSQQNLDTNQGANTVNLNQNRQSKMNQKQAEQSEDKQPILF